MKTHSKTILKLASVWILVLAFLFDPSLANGQDDPPAELAVVEVQEDERVDVNVDEDIDDDDFEEAVVINNPFGVETRKLIAAKKFQLTQLFAVEIEELKTICKLDKKQALKLKIATKGAVKKLTADWIKKNNQQMGNMMGGNQNAKKKRKKDEEELVFKDADEIDQMTLQVITMNMFGANPYQADDPRDSRFWKKTVSSVLTAEQQEKVKALRIEREKIKRNALTDYLVKSMAVELGMSESQTKKFDQIVRPALLSAKIDCISMYEPYLMYYYASKADEAKIKELFSPAQLQKWKIYLGPSKQIGQMIEGGGNQFVQVNEGPQEFWMDVDNMVSDIVRNVISLFDGFAKKKD